MMMVVAILALIVSLISAAGAVLAAIFAAKAYRLARGTAERDAARLAAQDVRQLEDGERERALDIPARMQRLAEADRADECAKWMQAVRAALQAGAGNTYPVGEGDRECARRAVERGELIWDPVGDGVMLPGTSLLPSARGGIFD